MLKSSAFILVATMYSLTLVGPARADKVEDPGIARDGVVLCGGNNFLRLDEAHTTLYTLHNFDSTQPIFIDELRVFDATGTVIFDSNASGLPASLNGILGGTNNTLGPNQTAQITSDSFLPFLAQSVRPIQLVIAWSSPNRALSLEVHEAQRARVAPNGVERSTNAVVCRSIAARKKD